jgi:hypothetical protein
MGNIILRYTTIIALTLASLNLSYSQGEANNWLVGIDHIMNFNTGEPEHVCPGVVQSSYPPIDWNYASNFPYHYFFATEYNTSIISDANGNLIFYSNGSKLYNANFEIIWAYSNIMPWQLEASQSLFIPKPGNKNRYYFFTPSGPNSGLGIRYTQLDKSLNNGLGGIVGLPNQLLYNTYVQKVTATYHYNNYDIWVIIHAWGSNQFIAYLVTKNGISSMPVTSSVGMQHSPTSTTYPPIQTSNAAGQMKFSSDGSKLAVAIAGSHKFEIFDFNNATGVVSNPMSFNLAYVNSVEFSLDGTLVYVGNLMPGSITYEIDTNSIYQYDLMAGTIYDIENSAYKVNSLLNGYAEPNVLQMAPNGKIYCSTYQLELNEIANPSFLDSLCDFHPTAFVLDTNINVYNCHAGYYNNLPAFFCSYFDKNILFKNNCYTDTSLIYTQTNLNFDSIRWGFNDPILGQISILNQDTISHLFPQPGNYEITLNRYRNGNLDVVKKVLYILPSFIMDLGPDSMICQGSTVDIALNELGCSFNWVNNFSSDTINSDTISITQSGLWWPVLTNFDDICGSMDSIEVDVFPDLLNLGQDNLSLCSTTGITLDASVNDSSANFLWNTGDTFSSLLVNEDGVYLVTVQQANCTFQDTISLAFDDPLTIALQDTLVLCNGMGMFISAGDYNASYIWYPNGETSADIWVQNQALYSVTVTNGCGDFSDSILVITLSSPSIDLGNDTAICESDSLWLNASFPQATYLWSTGDSISTILAFQETSYYVTVSNLCGCTIDSITVTINTPIILSLGNDTTICEGEFLELETGVQEASFAWSTGETTQSILINASGSYSVEATNQCNQAHDTILVDTHQVAFQFAQDSIGIDTNQVITLDAGAFWQFYQWSTGETTQSITIEDPGDFWVLLTDTLGCTANDTIKIYRLVNAPLLWHSPVRIFPNPANGVIYIDGLLGNEELFLYDVIGNMINTKFIKRSTTGTCMLSLPSKGVYLLLIRSENHSETFKLIRE